MTTATPKRLSESEKSIMLQVLGLAPEQQKLLRAHFLAEEMTASAELGLVGLVDVMVVEQRNDADGQHRVVIAHEARAALPRRHELIQLGAEPGERDYRVTDVKHVFGKDQTAVVLVERVAPVPLRGARETGS